MHIIDLPTRKSGLTFTLCMSLWLLITALFVGLRVEHLYMYAALVLLYLGNKFMRRLILGMLPFIIFGVSYDWMNICPNYLVRPVDIQGLYEAEKDLFGITLCNGDIVTPNEFWLLHKTPVMDFLCGVFYLCWVPVPILFGLSLFITRQYNRMARFAWAFLFVNLIGFCGYYIHPAAPPWYVMSHGFDFIQGTSGEVAGLGAFDQMTGWQIFHGLYERNANVFAAVPSLHSAYMVITFWHSLKAKYPIILRALFCVIMFGIWFTAIYTAHHYLIDVLLGAGCAVFGVLIFELGYQHVWVFRSWINAYCKQVEKAA